MREASFYIQQAEGGVECFLCSHYCRIGLNERGLCGVRENRGGRLWSLVYGRPVERRVERVEKNPFYHFLPGSLSYNLGSMGCNFSCSSCHYPSRAHGPKTDKRVYGPEISPRELAQEAFHLDCSLLTSSLGEPTVFLEYVLDAAQEARPLGMANALVTNGYMSSRAMNRAASVVDAAVVWLPALSDAFYTRQCGAWVQPVLANIREMRERGIWLEVLTPLLPEEWDTAEELKSIAEFLALLGEEIPWHITTAPFWTARAEVGQLREERLLLARQIGFEAGLKYVYLADPNIKEGRSTRCSGCGMLLVDRTGDQARNVGLMGNRCRRCSTRIEGVGLFGDKKKQPLLG